MLDLWKYSLDRDIVNCRACERLTEYRKNIKKTPRHLHEDYWSLPLCGFGDQEAQLFIIGLAPAAHGGNRTGRMFTGDQSGQWLTNSLYQTGFASQPTSMFKNDGLILYNAYISASIRCVPPENKPQGSEIHNCFPFLEREYLHLKNSIQVIVTLGGIAWKSFKALIKDQKLEMDFKHGNECLIEGNKMWISSYHPSRQNTNTKKLTWEMWIRIFRRAREFICSLK